MGWAAEAPRRSWRFAVAPRDVPAALIGWPGCGRPAIRAAVRPAERPAGGGSTCLLHPCRVRVDTRQAGAYRSRNGLLYNLVRRRAIRADAEVPWNPAPGMSWRHVQIPLAPPARTPRADGPQLARVGGSRHSRKGRFASMLPPAPGASMRPRLRLAQLVAQASWSCRVLSGRRAALLIRRLPLDTTSGSSEPRALTDEQPSLSIDVAPAWYPPGRRRPPGRQADAGLPVSDRNPPP
jgi:hypothetical protein